MPHIARQVQLRCSRLRGWVPHRRARRQWPAQASGEAAVPDPPEVALRGYVNRYITLSDWEGQGERSPSRLIGRQSVHRRDRLPSYRKE